MRKNIESIIEKSSASQRSKKKINAEAQRHREKKFNVETIIKKPLHLSVSAFN